MSNRKDQPFDNVERPRHYNSHPSGVEAVDICEHLSFNLGNAVKYAFRAGLKDNESATKDLDEARWYLEREQQRLLGKTGREHLSARLDLVASGGDLIAKVLSELCLLPKGDGATTTPGMVGGALALVKMVLATHPTPDRSRDHDCG